MEYMFLPLKRYVDFSGRSRRKEFWLWILFYLVMLAIALTLDVQLGLGGSSTGSSEFGDGNVSASFNVNGGLLSLLWVLIALIPNISVSVRRLHDIDKSGWWILIGLVPLLGFLYLLFLYTQPGTTGSNRFGPDPKEPGASQVFS